MMIKHSEPTHFREVQPYKTYSNPEFRGKIISLFTPPDLRHVNIKELLSAQQKRDESILEYMRRVHGNFGKAFPKLADGYRARAGRLFVLPWLRRPASWPDESNRAEGRCGVGSTYCYFADGIWQKSTQLRTLRGE